MVLAAGLGTRLRPVTDDRPKALVEVAGHTLLELTLVRLRRFGIGEVIVNTHHFADLVIAYLQKHKNFGMRVEISREDVLLDTGGGLLQAAPFFLESASERDEPFLLHNVDVLSTIDFTEMLRTHRDSRALATLAVRNRPTSRYLLFDENDQLCGRQSGLDGFPELCRPAERFHALGFSGIHVLSPRIFELMSEEGVFPIIPAYLRLAAEGDTVLGFRSDRFYWRDLGRLKDIEAAADDIAKRIYPV